MTARPIQLFGNRVRRKNSICHRGGVTDVRTKKGVAKGSLDALPTAACENRLSVMFITS
jgi:hypothetical protein